MISASIQNQTALVERGYGRKQEDIRLETWANQRYDALIREGIWDRLVAKLTGRETRLIYLHPETAMAPEGESTRETIRLEQIIGSCGGRVEDFDNRFRPTSRHNQSRWVSVATACKKHKALPPVECIRIGNKLFVVDGHHRISVAAALGRDEIDAHITDYQMI